jgi:protein involved in polysaccharide export with SLBB domain
MRVTRRLMLFVAVALAAGGCARDPVMRVQMAAAPSPYGIDNVVYGSAAGPAYAPMAAPSYAAPAYAGPSYAMAPAPTYAAPAAPAYGAGYGTMAAPTYAPAAAPAYAASPYGTAMVGGYPGAMMASPVSYAPPPNMQWPYTLDTGDRLRVVVFGQEGLTNSYVLDASGQMDMPLIGTVQARGLTVDQLSARIADMLRQGYVREPHVSVEVEAYRPFFILGEVTQPGQYPYSPNMTVETAVAIAGGFGPRGYKKAVTISRNYAGQVYRFETPITAPVQPGDTIKVQERWF